jgi:hypothetical protein
MAKELSSALAQIDSAPRKNAFEAAEISAFIALPTATALWLLFLFVRFLIKPIPDTEQAKGASADH